MQGNIYKIADFFFFFFYITLVRASDLLEASAKCLGREYVHEVGSRHMLLMKGSRHIQRHRLPFPYLSQGENTGGRSSMAQGQLHTICIASLRAEW